MCDIKTMKAIFFFKNTNTSDFAVTNASRICN